MGVILMELLIKINNQTSGRDKLARFIQYSSKALWYFIQQHRLSGAKSIEEIKRLELVFSTFRKILRFGRFVESFYGASQSFKNPDQLLKFSCTLSKLAFGMYLFCDHVICLEKTGLMEIQSQKWSTMANKYWTYALLCLVLRDCYEIFKIGNLLKNKSFNEICSIFLKNHKDVLIDTLKNSCDLVIPTTALGYLNLSPGMVGLMGSVSSLLGLLPLIEPLLKLVPS